MNLTLLSLHDVSLDITLEVLITKGNILFIKILRYSDVSKHDTILIFSIFDPSDGDCLCNYCLYLLPSQCRGLQVSTFTCTCTS